MMNFARPNCTTPGITYRRRCHNRHRRIRRLERARIFELERIHHASCPLCIQFHVYDFFKLAALKTYTTYSFDMLSHIVKSLTPTLLPCNLCSYVCQQPHNPYVFSPLPSPYMILNHLWFHKHPPSLLLADCYYIKFPYHNQALLGLLFASLNNPDAPSIKACDWFLALEHSFQPHTMNFFLSLLSFRNKSVVHPLSFLALKAIMRPYLIRLTKYVYLHYTLPPLLSSRTDPIPPFNSLSFSLL